MSSDNRLSSQASASLSQRFTRLLIEPSPAIKYPEERRRARLLAALLVVMLPLYFIPEAIRAAASTRVTFYLVPATIALALSYYFSRTKHYRIGIFLTLSAFTLMPFIEVLRRADYDPDHLLITLIWVVPILVVGSLVLDPAGMRILVAANLFGALLLPLLVPQIEFAHVVVPIGYGAITAVFLLVGSVVHRNDLRQIEAKNRDLVVREARYRSLFENAPISLWEEDYSAVKQYLDQLRRGGVDDLAAYFDEHPEAVQHCVELITVTNVNQMTLDLYGARSREELLSSLPRIMRSGEIVPFRGQILALWGGQRQYVSETINTTLTGEAKHVIAQLTIIAGAEETWDEILVAVVDITEHKQADAEIRKLSQAVEQSDSTIVITDADGTIEYVNPAFTRITGYTAEEALGQNPRILKSEQHSPEFYQDMWHTLMRGETWRGELVNKKKNGELYWENATISPVKNDEGKTTHYVAIKDDITARKQVEEELRKLHRAAENTASGILIANVDGVIEYVNPAFTQITGYSPEEVIGENPRILKSGEHKKEFYQDLWRTIECGEIWRGEIVNRKKNGELYWEFQTISPVKDDVGHITHYVAVKTYITERKKMETALTEAHKQAVEASRLKTRLLANVSHDMRTPMGAIMGYAEMLGSDALGPTSDDQKDAVSNILGGVHQLLDFVNNLIGQAEIESGKIILNAQPFTPQSLLNMISNDIALAQNKKLTVTTEIAPQLPEKILGDRYWLGQILRNLLSNAVKFTPRGSVQIALLRPEESRWAIRVSDTGPGISSKAQKHIFEAFRQVNETASRHEHTGSGLGLSIVSHLAELMGGEVQLDSVPGKGSTFTVFLPLMPAKDKDV